MAALDFPASPVSGNTYTANGKSWVYNGEFWAASTKKTVDTATTPPANPVDGEIWWNSEIGSLQVYTTTRRIPFRCSVA